MSTLDPVSEIEAMIDVLDNAGRETSAQAVGAHLLDMWGPVRATFPAGDAEASRIGKLIAGLSSKNGSLADKARTLRGALVGLKVRAFDRQR